VFLLVLFLIGYKRVRRGIHMGCNSCFLELYSNDLILATIAF